MSGTFVPAGKPARNGDDWEREWAGENDDNVIPLPPPSAFTQTASTKNVDYKSNALDGARAFNKITIPLALTFGIAVASITLMASNTPVWSLAALSLFFGGTVIAWLCAYVVHMVLSPYGHLWLQAVLTYRYLRYDQINRQQRLNAITRYQLETKRLCRQTTPSSMTPTTQLPEQQQHYLPAPTDTRQQDQWPDG